MKAIFYFADGFSYEYVNPQLPFTHGVWQARPLETILGYSSSIVPVLLSGRSPRETGLWTEYFRADRAQTRFERVASSNSLLTHLVNMVRLVVFRFARKAGHPAAHTLRIPVQLAHHFRRNDIRYDRMPPCEMDFPTIDEVCRALGLTFTSVFADEGKSATDIVSLFSQTQPIPDVMFVYDPAIDHAGHRTGPGYDGVRIGLQRMVDIIDGLTELAGGPEACEILAFSDHGMTGVTDSYDLFARLSDLTIGRDYLCFPDSTFARFWYLNEAARVCVRDALADAPGRFLAPEEGQALGVPVPSAAYGEDVLVANAGTVFHPSYISPSFFRTPFPDKGMHGYMPDAPGADGVVLYAGQAAGRLPARVAASEVFDLMHRIAKTLGQG